MLTRDQVTLRVFFALKRNLTSNGYENMGNWVSHAHGGA